MEQNEKRYNGWTNYETWATALWLDNDQARQHYWRDASSQCREEAPETSQVRDGFWTMQQAARFTLADRLKEEVSDGSPLLSEASLYADLLGAALQEVEWQEIATHLLENLDD